MQEAQRWKKLLMRLKYEIGEVMKRIVLTLLLIALASTLGISIVLGECIQIYTDSVLCHVVFQMGFGFLSSFFVSHFIIQNYVKILWE